jgi:hypothetical protein
MPKFRKKPVVIEAERFSPSAKVLPFQDDAVCQFNGDKWLIETLEGDMTISDGDWIIKGVNNEFYPCKPDIFEKTYEPVEESEAAE